MRVEIQEVGSGLHPEEAVVIVETREGPVHLAVDRASLDGTTLDIGWPVGHEKDFALIELPRETFQGFWRVWVPRSALKQDEGPKKVYA